MILGTFTGWLLSQADRDDAVGNLARSMADACPCRRAELDDLVTDSWHHATPSRHLADARDEWLRFKAAFVVGRQCGTRGIAYAIALQESDHDRD